jgi:hypothetical protein
MVVLTKREPPARKPIAHGQPAPRGLATVTAIRMIFAGANTTPRVTGLQELPGKANYFIGNDPTTWRTNVPTYAKVRYDDIYPGIDLIYYGNQRQLEYDFVVRPGADPTRIVLGFQGAARLEVDAQGDLVLHTAAGPIRQRKPVIYQEVDGVRTEIQGGYVLTDRHQVSFRVAAYVASQPLIIDPVLFYSTYLGSGGLDGGSGIAVDTAGNAYVTGETFSMNFLTPFPTTPGSFQTTSGVGSDAFVTKLNPTGSALVYSTYLAGSGFDTGSGIAVDALGNAYVTGATRSGDFPTTLGAFQPTFGGGFNEAFVTKLNPTGSALVYSTYLGGRGGFLGDGGSGIAVDGAGNAYVTGATDSPDFPTTVGAVQPTIRGGFDAFVTKLNPTGSALVYSTYLGGTSASDEGSGIAVDTAGNAYVTGSTFSRDFPTTVGAFQTTRGGGFDAFVTKLNPTGSALVYSTYLGGSDFDFGNGIAVDTAGNVYVTGRTDSSDFPTTLGAFQTTFGGGFNDAFVTKLNPTGSALVYSTYLGGSRSGDVGLGIALDTAGHAYVTGETNSSDFPTTVGALQPTFGGGFSDAFVTTLDPTGSALVYSTYLGGSGTPIKQDTGFGIAVDTAGNAYVTGETSSSDFPTTAGAFQPTFGGTSDAFVAKITGIVPPPPPTAGKVTGGGSINVAGGIGTFGFNVQRKATDAPIHGNLQYVNPATTAKVHSVAFTSFAIVGNTATFGGTCTLNGAPCTFEVNVTDTDEPDFADTFTISVVPGTTEGGTLRGGNIQIHQ